MRSDEASTMRARRTTPCGAVRDRTSSLRLTRSVPVNSISRWRGRPILLLLLPRHSMPPHQSLCTLFLGHHTRNLLPKRDNDDDVELSSIAAIAEERVSVMESSINDLLKRVTKTRYEDSALDEAIARFIRVTDRRPDEIACIPRYSVSLDDALTLIKKFFPDCSLSIHVKRDGTAYAEIGVPNTQESWLVFKSDRKKSLLPARAALQVLFKALKGEE